MNILIMGAGTVGMAFARRLYKDHKVTLLDNCEWPLAACDLPIEKLLMDKEDWRYCDHPCDVVLLTSDYKHLPLGQENIEAFIKNNIDKTLRVMREAYKYNADVLYTSTDKAVEPCSTYGATKYLGEMMARHFNFAVSRMGNILGSSGSVIPLWEEKIKNKQPIPITDERMVRYWIEDYEAVDQIWSQFQAGNRLIIPQCQKIRLLDLLTKVLKRHGYERPDDYEPGVTTIGLRPGEKLDERLRWSDEG